jgi:hypothetical protein
MVHVKQRQHDFHRSVEAFVQGSCVMLHAERSFGGDPRTFVRGVQALLLEPTPSVCATATPFCLRAATAPAL